MTIAPVTRSTWDPEPAPLYLFRVRGFRFSVSFRFTLYSLGRHLGLRGAAFDGPPELRRGLTR